jgi:hypothetical protein
VVNSLAGADGATAERLADGRELTFLLGPAQLDVAQHVMAVAEPRDVERTRVVLVMALSVRKTAALARLASG